MRKHSIHSSHVTAIANHAHARMSAKPDTTPEELEEHLFGCLDELGVSVSDEKMLDALISEAEAAN